MHPVIDGLNIKDDGCYLDGTFGRGGHSAKILNVLGTAGRLIAIDRDPAAIIVAQERFDADKRFEIVKGEIAELKNIVLELGLLGKVDGLLFDLGVSSPQLDESERGFSFQSDGPLDMRMDPSSGQSAADWIAVAQERDLRNVLFKFGEEKSAVRIARAIIAARKSRPINRTSELAEIVSAANPVKGQRRHPATKTFQAIRIQVNDELHQLEDALSATVDVLAPRGRLCVISFHSLEDRIVKRFIRTSSNEPEQYRGMPNIPLEHLPPFKSVGKAITASDEEIAQNVRARSARLRIAERL